MSPQFWKKAMIQRSGNSSPKLETHINGQDICVWTPQKALIYSSQKFFSLHGTEGEEMILSKNQ